MKGGRFLKKFKFIPSITHLKQGIVLQLNQNCHGHGISVFKDQDCKTNIINLPEPVKEEEEKALEYYDVVEEEISLPDEEEEHPCLTDFEEKCPPGGEDSVIFYTTSMRGIRKTFEDCSSVRFLLESFKIKVYERDVAMDMEFREELWRVMGGNRVIPPKLFIKGRLIGGADEVVGLHEQGKLKKLFEGIPSNLPNCPCSGCGNMRFLVCSNCNGSRKVYNSAEKEGDNEMFMKCHDCNENGLVKCPVCC
ncbi:Glutaredoxin [Corchorus olitorius]|uniref:Glutaredoxin n=1 Tax=Corchorus olitorius TaxID=93759 RepID=A0A1R3HE52_9ROSI|nr:Glutaredoxin [Corchorus olitorius]